MTRINISYPVLRDKLRSSILSFGPPAEPLRIAWRRWTNQHLLAATERNLLMSMECSGTQATHAADDGPDPSSFATAEYAAEQRTSAGPDRRMLDALAARPPDSIAPSTSTFSPEGAW